MAWHDENKLAGGYKGTIVVPLYNLVTVLAWFALPSSFAAQKLTI